MFLKLLAAAARSALVLLLAALAGATLVRFAPGYGSDALDLDTRLSPAAREAIRESLQQKQESLPAFYSHYLKNLIKGELGWSIVFQRKAVELLSDRAPSTVGTVVAGVVLAWLVAVPLACAASARPGSAVDRLVLSGQALSLAVPLSLVALVCLLQRWPAWIGMAFAATPTLVLPLRTQLGEVLGLPHVLAARARGVDGGALWKAHILPPMLPSLRPLGALSVLAAFGMAIPLEAITDTPGLGQLVWKAALGRDLTLLVDVTLALTLLSLVTRAAAAQGKSWAGSAR